MKIRVGVLYGGKTTEHEVSIITAVQAMEHLNIIFKQLAYPV